MVSHQTLCDIPSPQPSSQHHHHHQQSIYQPCLPPFDPGATKILPFLYLGSQTDAFNKDLLKSHNITYELNVSTTCPKPDHVKESHFLRIPVNDSYNERLIPYFPIAFDFLEKVRKSEECALVHCFAGISRSTTIVIAYLMQHSRLTFDDAYRYVKSKRATISPNFHFLGQLLEYEEILKKEWITEPNKVDTILLSPLPIKEDISIEQKPLFSPTIMPLSSSCSALSSLTSPALSGQPLNGKRHNLTLKMPTKSQRNIDEVTDNSQNQADQSSNDTLTKLSFSNSNSTSTSQSINSFEICDRLKQRPIEEIISTCPRAGRRSESCSSQTVPIGDPMPSSATTNVTRTAEKRRADSSTSTISFNLPLRSYAKSDSRENGIDPHIKAKTGKIEENNQVPIPMRCSTGEEHSSEEEFCTRSEISMDTTAGSSSPESSQESVHDNSSTLASKVSDIKNCSSVPVEDPDFEPMVLRRDIMGRKCNPSVTSQDSAYVSMIMDSGRGTLFLWLVAKK